jgi:(p)ppGpp synthase/HD superfamily hydrolase
MKNVLMDDEKKLRSIMKSVSPKECTLILKAFICCKECHDGQKRKSGHDYYTHPLFV